MVCFLGVKSRTLSRCLGITVSVREGVTGQNVSRRGSGGVSMPNFVGCCGMGLQSVGPLPSSFSSGTSSPCNSLTLTFTHIHLRLLQGYTGRVACSQANPASGTFGCLSEMAFAVCHPTHRRSVEWALLHKQWHRVTFCSGGKWLPATATMLIC